MSALSDEDVTDRLAAIEETYVRADAGGICVVDGFGCRVVVERGALEIHDGIGEQRRTRRYDRATHGLSRVVCLNPDRVVSFAALRWCQSLGIGVLILGPDGTATLSSTPRSTDDARIRRAQAMASGQPIGLEIARTLLGAKLRGQALITGCQLEQTEVASTIADLAIALDFAVEVDEARQLEATAAALYFGAWANRPETSPVFIAKDRRRVPAHWSTFETRRSVLGSAASNRKAERPTNALLNYTFALVGAEAVLACQAVGLDPGLGIVHADTKGRASMALDLIEPVRPEVEAFVLDLLAARTFRKADFAESGDGHVRCMPPLTHALAETLPQWRRSLGPWAEKVVHLIGSSLEGSYHPATPLTGSRGKAAQAAVNARRTRQEVLRATASSSTRLQRPASKTSHRPLGCVNCGAVITNHRHVRCDDCIAADSAQTPEVRSRRGQAIASRKRQLRDWDESHPGVAYDPQLFNREILPLLATVKLTAIMAATGCSKGSASDIRRGKWAPHVSTWAALAALVNFEVPSREPQG